MFYTQQHNIIAGRNIWHHLIDSPIGHIHIVQYEKPSQEIVSFLIEADNDKAERKFASLCIAILNGKL
jgi:hypothetical protein